MKKKRVQVKAKPKRRLVAISAAHHTALTQLAAIGRRDIGAEAERLIDEEIKRQRADGGDLRDLAATAQADEAATKAERERNSQ